MCSTFTYGNKYTHLYMCVYLYAHTHTPTYTHRASSAGRGHPALPAGQCLHRSQMLQPVCAQWS